MYKTISQLWDKNVFKQTSLKWMCRWIYISACETMHSTLVIRTMQINIITAHCSMRHRTGQMKMTAHATAAKDAEELKLHTSLMMQPISANRCRLLNSTPALQPNHSAPRYLSQRKGNTYPLRTLHESFLSNH